MPRSLALAIPQPCHQAWVAMTPTAHGRHCAACDKVVIDFTQKTDAEILAALKQASAPCGRFRADQLNRSMATPAAPAPRWRTWLAAAATVWGLREGASNDALAQQPASTQAQMLRKAATSPRPSEADVPVTSGSFVLRGRVVDASTGEGLPGVTVLIQETTIGTSTGADGMFELAVPGQSAEALGGTVVVSAIGYENQLFDLRKLLASPAPVELKASSVALGGLVVTCVASCRKPWPWHPRAFWFWATRPFRR